MKQRGVNIWKSPASVREVPKAVNIAGKIVNVPVFLVEKCEHETVLFFFSVTRQQLFLEN